MRSYNFTKQICAFVLQTICSLIIAFAIMVGIANGQTSSDTKLTYAYDVKIIGDEKVTRVIIDFNENPKINLFYMTQPNRLVVELDKGLFQLDENQEIKAIGLINSARAGSITTSKARLVLSLSGPALLETQDLQVFEGSSRHRLVLELGRTDANNFAKILNSQNAVLGTSGNVTKKGDRVRGPQKKSGEFIVVIDPGHGGIDGGAQGKSKTLEKHITLKVAKQVGAYLEANGPYKVVYTRSEDVFMSLKARLAFTKRSNADLMISLHADTLKQRHVRGATIYTLAKKASDKLSAELAHSENLADLVAGLAAPQAKDDVTDILADLTLRETTKFSKSFSNRLKARLERKVTLIKNPQRSASFAVLKNLDVPSVLVELGYLSNRDDELLLNDPNWRETAAQQIVAAIIDFFKGRSPNH